MSARNVLIVDDDEVYRGILMRALERRGYVASAVGDVQAARKVVEATRFDVAIIDLRMPGEMGLALVHTLRTSNEAMTIVMLTAYGSIATAVEAMRLGANDYLLKPVDVEQLFHCLSQTRDDNVQHPVEMEHARRKPLSLDEFEWEHIQRTLVESDGNVTQAAKQLGLHRRSLQRKLERRPKNS